VRALLTLLIVGIVCLQVARGETIDLLWTETLAIALAHYFTTRRFVDLPPDLLQRLKDEGQIPVESNPLYLPGHTVRGLIILAFLGLTLTLQRQGRLLDSQALEVLGLVGAYLLGVIGLGFKRRLARGNRFPALRAAWDDLRALAVLGVMAVTFAAYALDREASLPGPWRALTLVLALYYFGSR
jgi:hypothetical protein